MKGSLWSLEREQLLARLCATERYARDIADKLGVTRNAVIGKVGRMRRQGHPLELKGTPGQRPKGYGRRIRKPATPNAARPAPMPPMPPPARDANGLRVAPRLKMRRLSLLELEQWCCRWPVGEPGTPGFFFCGNDTVGGESYCLPHFRYAHHA